MSKQLITMDLDVICIDVTGIIGEENKFPVDDYELIVNIIKEHAKDRGDGIQWKEFNRFYNRLQCDGFL